MTLIGAALFVVLIFLFGLIRSHLLKSPDFPLNVSILIVLLANPHLYNYDFVLLLIPFALLAEVSSSWFDELVRSFFIYFPS